LQPHRVVGRVALREHERTGECCDITA